MTLFLPFYAKSLFQSQLVFSIDKYPDVNNCQRQKREEEYLIKGARIELVFQIVKILEVVHEQPENQELANL